MNLQKEIACIQGEPDANVQIEQYSLQLICPAAVMSLIFTKACENRWVIENMERDNSEQLLSSSSNTYCMLI